MNQPKFIVLEGIDGVGKSTQVGLLKSYLLGLGIRVEHIHFPRLDSKPFGELIAAFLRGEFGPIDLVDPRLVALLYAEDRQDFSHTMREWLSGDICIIADRYVFSNIAFQCAKYSDSASRQQLRDWIIDLEYGHFNLPRPAISFFLDLHTSSAAQAMAQDVSRDQRAYLGGVKDIHEADLGFQEKVRLQYIHLTQTEQDFHLISCNDDAGNRFPPEHTHDRLVAFLNPLFNAS